MSKILQVNVPDLTGKCLRSRREMSTISQVHTCLRSLREMSQISQVHVSDLTDALTEELLGGLTELKLTSDWSSTVYMYNDLIR